MNKFGYFISLFDLSSLSDECCFQQGVHGFDILGLGSRESLLLMWPFLDVPFLVHQIASTYFRWFKQQLLKSVDEEHLDARLKYLEEEIKNMVSYHG
jgi:hypothetical protein